MTERELLEKLTKSLSNIDKTFNLEIKELNKKITRIEKKQENERSNFIFVGLLTFFVILAIVFLSFLNS